MKAKYLFVAAAAVTLMAACSENDALSVQNPAQQQGETPVSFETYMGRATTRAGAVGEIVTKEELQVNSFGVFAYYTNGETYPSSYFNDATWTTAKFKPDFMWNQKVEFDGDNWFYFPVKYWPNESASGSNYVDAADPTGNHATAAGAAAPDKVTFFAYAPYVDASTSGAVTPNTDGITAIYNPSSTEPALNAVASDPLIAYKTPTDPLKTVDLLWGVVPAYKTRYSTVVPEGAEQTVTAGMPNYNLVKQTTDERIMFQFKHALAKLTLDVVGFFDDVPGLGANQSPEAVSENNVAKDTKIVVEYVKLFTNKYPSSSVLNLNNWQAANLPNWDNRKNSGNVNFTINGSQLTNLIRYRTPSAADKAYDEQPRGVTNEAVALLANDASQEAFFGIIPEINPGNSASKWTAEIKYHVFTKDANLENGYSEITNVIKKEDIDMTLDPGKHYTLRLRLGMTTVKFDATVEDWVDGGTTPADLPINVAVKYLSNFKLTAEPYSGAIATGYSNIANQAADFTIGNCSYKLSVAALKAMLENGTSSTDLAAGFVLNSDVDWIAYDHSGKFIIEENLTSASRSAKVWATYGGVDSAPITITQNGSNLTLSFYYYSGDFFEKEIDWDNTGSYPFELSARYVDQTNSSASLNYTADAYSTAIFNHENWISVDPSAKTITVLSKNEDEVSPRVSNISFSYGGKTCEPIKLTQKKKQ